MEVAKVAEGTVSGGEAAPVPDTSLRRRIPLQKWDLFLLATAIGSLILNCIIISDKKPFWNDELIAWTAIHDPSLRHMVHALAQGVPYCAGLSGR